MKQLSITVMCLLIFPFIGLCGGLLSYAALRITGYPESDFVFKMLLGVWGGLGASAGIYEAVKSVLFFRKLKKLHKNKQLWCLGCRNR